MHVGMSLTNRHVYATNAHKRGYQPNLARHYSSFIGCNINVHGFLHLLARRRNFRTPPPPHPKVLMVISETDVFRP